MTLKRIQNEGHYARGNRGKWGGMRCALKKKAAHCEGKYVLI